MLLNVNQHTSMCVIDGLVMKGNYSFQYCHNVEIRNSKIYSKDAFWNSEEVIIYDSEINGEYLGWHSKKLKLINCKITGTQPFCYCEDLVIENCTMDDSCDLCFEYSTLKADVCSVIKSIKNPSNGIIIADGYDELIQDENTKEPNDCVIQKRNKFEKEKFNITFCEKERCMNFYSHCLQ